MSQVFGAIAPEVQSDIESLEAFGYLSTEVHKWGRSWTLRTLKGDEDLAIGIITKPYVETMAQAKAWAWAHIGLALEAVNGDTNFCPPIGPDTLEYARARFKWVTENYDWFIGEYLFSEFVGLQQRQMAALEAMQDFSSRSRAYSSPVPASLSDLGISPEELAPEEG